MGRPVVHWEIAGPDLEGLRDFYAVLFGWRANHAEGARYSLVETGNLRGIDGGLMQAAAGTPSYVTFYVEVDDLESTLRVAERLGGRIALAPTVAGSVGRFAFFSDPQGNCIGLYSRH